MSAGFETAFEAQSLASFPTSPGVYIMKNAAGDVLYVGKAANLRSRVRNYFTRSGDTRFTLQFLVRHVSRVEFIVTANEKEAFLLENTLIKQHKPRYNIQLRDDKTYVSLRLRMNHDFPRLEIVRVRRFADLPRSGRDLYFGPYTSAGSVRETLRFLLRVLPVRTCKDSVFANRTRPCILYDIGKCCGPCVLPIERDDYSKLVEGVAKFLRGKSDEVRELLMQRMHELSESMEFERAAVIRDRLEALDATLEKQHAAVHTGGDRDVIAVVSQQGRSLAVIQEYRSGVLTHSREFYFKNYEQEDSEILYAVIQQHYGAGAAGVPREVLVNVEPTDCVLLEEWLADLRGSAAELSRPQRGDRVRAVEMAEHNAREQLSRKLSGEKNDEEVLGDVARKLHLPRVPKVIECVDISNIMGVLAVGSLVRFEGLSAAKNGYRMFRIRTVDGANDFAMMREVLSRRFRADGRGEFPDLLIVDGGKGQLAIAVQVMQELGITDVAVAALAKSRLKTAPKPGDATSRARYRTDERVFLPGRKNPVTFPPNSPALYLVQRIRDEAHRFAITYHRKLRQKTNRHSVLEEIPGIGAQRKRLLLRHFGSLSALRAASLEGLESVEGMSRPAAEAVYSFFHAPHAAPVTEVFEPEAADIDDALIPDDHVALADDAPPPTAATG